MLNEGIEYSCFGVATRVRAVILNQQAKVHLSLAAVRAFVQRLRAVLHLGRRDFNICLVDDRQMARLNRAFLGRSRPTDVLSFPWTIGEGSAVQRAARGRAHTGATNGEKGSRTANKELANFLGDIAVSVETARRNARREGHSTLNEIRWLILHGLLHLLGYDHEQDRGEMTSRELSLRERLGIAGR